MTYMEKLGALNDQENISQNNEILDAPEGWDTKYGTSIKLQVSRKKIDQILTTIGKDNPEYFKDFKTTQGTSREHYSPELINIIREKLEKEVSKAPEGWEVAQTVAIKTGQTHQAIKKIANSYRKDNPEYFQDYKDKMGRVNEHYSPEFLEVITKDLSKVKEILEAKDGWQTNNTIATDLNINYKKVKQIAENYRIDHPESFKDLKTHLGQVVEHYSPELVKYIAEQFSKYQNPPDGWKTKNALAEELETYNQEIQRLSDLYQVDHPEYFKDYRVENGQIRKHFSPELVELIKNDLEKTEIERFKNNESLPDVPKGWEVRNSLTDLGVGYRYINKFIVKYDKKYTDYSKEFKGDTGKKYTYYSPDFVKALKKEIKKFQDVPKAPDDWKTKQSLVEEFNISGGGVERIVNKYRDLDEKNFKYLRSKSGPIREYYSPELVEILTKEIIEFKNVPEAPEGWKNASALSKEFKLEHPKIKEMVNKYRESHEDYFKDFKDKSKRVTEHYSPELTKLIVSEIEKDKNILEAPKGWMLNNTLCNELDVDFYVISKLVKPYKESNPEYF